MHYILKVFLRALKETFIIRARAPCSVRSGTGFICLGTKFSSELHGTQASPGLASLWGYKKPHYPSPTPKFYQLLLCSLMQNSASMKDPWILLEHRRYLLPSGAAATALLGTWVSAGHYYLLLPLRHEGPWNAKAAVPFILVDEGKCLLPLWHPLLEKTK